MRIRCRCGKFKRKEGDRNHSCRPPRLGTKLSKAHKQRISEANRGRQPWCKGLHLPKSTRLKISEKLKKYVKTEDHRKNLSLSLKGRIKSKKHRKNIGEALKAKGIKPPSQRGKIPWNYKGATPFQEAIRKTLEYKQWRSNIFTRDNFTCQRCGSRGGRLEAHHIKEFHKILNENSIKTVEEALRCVELWDTKNGITFCKKCHCSKIRRDKIQNEA